MKTLTTAAALALGLVAGGCSGGGSPVTESSTGRLAIELTDAPFDHSLVQSALIEISDIQFHVQGDAESGFVDGLSGSPVLFDLMRLRNGLTRRVESDPLPPGEYRQIRLVISNAMLVLNDGREFSTMDGTLQLPSAASSGLKFFLDPPVQLEEGGLGRILLDFDMTKSFKPVPANDPAKARSFLLTPVVRTHTGPMNSLSGVVTTMDDQGTSVAVDLAVVYLLPPGETDLQKSIASTATDADGSMTILGIEEGTYDVVVTKDDMETRVDGVFVAGSGSTHLDVTLE